MKYLGTFLIILCLTGCEEGWRSNTQPDNQPTMYTEEAVKSMLQDVATAAFLKGRATKIEGCSRNREDSV